MLGSYVGSSELSGTLMAALHKYLICTIALGLVGSLGHAQVVTPPRQLAPGVITTIRDLSVDDDVIDPPREFTELLSSIEPRVWKPNTAPSSQILLEKAKSVIFRRTVYSLEFGFKPLRVVRIDGVDVWYLPYFVRNIGAARSPKLTVGSELQIETVPEEVTFVPTFVLRSHDLGEERVDQVLPAAVRVIAAKERVPGRLHDSESISREPIPVSTEAEVWGVATWVGVDPRSDYISVYVQGLTNAYRLAPTEGDGRRKVLSKSLQLNFWRSGDAIRLSEQEITYGIPLYPDDAPRQQEVLDAYQLKKPLEYQWVFR